MSKTRAQIATSIATLVDNTSATITPLIVRTALDDLQAAAQNIVDDGPFLAARLAKTGAYTVVAADRGKMIDCTSGTFTLSLTAAATLGDGFAFGIWNSGSGTITIDPNGSETIRDGAGSATTNAIAQGQGGIIVCDASGFFFLKFAGLVNSVTTSAGAGDSGKIPALNGSGKLDSSFVSALGTPASGNLGSCTVDGTTAVGFLSVPSNSQSAAYTGVITDSGKSLDHPSTDANARTFTIPANSSVAYTVGTCLSFSNMTSQAVTIAITSDTLYLAGAGTTGSRTLAQYGVATARKLTSTTWLINGTGLT